MASKNADKLIKCINCRHARLLQWMENPLLSECDFSHECQVAGVKRMCDHFEFTETPNQDIKHYDRYNPLPGEPPLELGPMSEFEEQIAHWRGIK